MQRTAGSVPRAHAAALSGVLATTNQLALVTGIAAGGTLYLAAGYPYVLLAIAGVQALTGAAVALPLSTRPLSTRPLSTPALTTGTG